MKLRWPLLTYSTLGGALHLYPNVTLELNASAVLTSLANVTTLNIRPSYFFFISNCLHLQLIQFELEVTSMRVTHGLVTTPCCLPKMFKTRKTSVCTVKVLLYWFQGKKVVHSTSGVLGLELLKKTEVSLQNTFGSLWLLEGMNIQLRFNYVPQVK